MPSLLPHEEWKYNGSAGRRTRRARRRGREGGLLRHDGPDARAGIVGLGLDLLELLLVRELAREVAARGALAQHLRVHEPAVLQEHIRQPALVTDEGIALQLHGLAEQQRRQEIL